MHAGKMILSLLTISLASVLSISLPVSAQPPVASTVIQAETFSQAELDQMLAPIALYPDTVLSHILIAATYPLEIVKATRWLSSQAAMTSEQALKAAENEPWDPSVRALVAFPPLLTKMNNELEWTQRLGDAFLVQEELVMATVQSLRERAYAAGNLQNQEHITVQRQQKVIVIEPRQPEVVYVPIYDTRVVYGDWWWRQYPPVHWPYPGYHSGHSYVYWGIGARVSSTFYFSTFYWPHSQIVVINHHRPNRYYRHYDIIQHEERRHWRHNPKHRHGVVYHRAYQPTRESSGIDQRSHDIGERRRWAVDQRERNHVSMPDDQRIREQYPAQLRRTDNSISQRVAETDRPAIVRQVDPMPQQRRQQRPHTAETQGPEQVRPVFDQKKRMERSIDIEQPLPVERRPEAATRQRVAPDPVVRQDRPVYQAPRPVERQDRRVYETPQPIERQERPVYETPKPVERQERPVYETPKPVERQERPVYETPRPIERQEQPVYQAPRPVERQERPAYQEPKPIERQERPVYETPRPVERVERAERREMPVSRPIESRGERSREQPVIDFQP